MERELGFYMQQQEARLRAQTAAAMMVVRRRNMSKMLGSDDGMAIKKTVWFS